MIKTILRNSKNILNDLLRRLNIRKTIITTLNYKIFSTKYKNTFFGYYDKTPFSEDNQKLLAIATNHDDILIEPKEAIVGYFNLDDGSFQEIDKTTTWCWQQGCRLMWFTDTSVIYNKIVNDSYGSVVYDLEKSEIIQQYSFSIYDKTKDNKYALSLNFSRLQYFRPGYGYSNFLVEEDKVKIKEDDGIFICDLENNSKKILITLNDIIETEANETFKDAYHYINHLKFSPNDKIFIFYHIWNKGSKRYTRAILAGIDGKILKVLNSDSFMSHYSFKSDNELLIYTKIKMEGYHKYNITDNNDVDIFCQPLSEDGHPTFINDNRILTDTYPDRLLREQKLIVADKNDYEVIAKVYSPFKYQKEFRCDFHPRLSPDNKYFCIDIPAFEGRRLMVLENE